MRPLLLGAFILSGICAHAQLNGYTFHDDHETYLFMSEHIFSWQYRSENESVTGEGKYKVKGDSIELTFDQVKRTFELQLYRSAPNKTDQSHIEVRAMLSNGKPYEDLRLWLFHSGVSVYTDTRGIAKIDVSDALFKDDIKVDLDGFVSTIATIDLRGNDHAFGIVIDETAPRYREYTSMTFAFKKRWRKIFLAGKKYKQQGHRASVDLGAG